MINKIWALIAAIWGYCCVLSDLDDEKFLLASSVFIGAAMALHTYIFAKDQL